MVVIAIAGGSGSGKTTLARTLEERLKKNTVSYLTHDYYYKDRSNLSYEEKQKINYDHPDSLDTKQLVEDIKKLKEKKNVTINNYDFSTHCKTKEIITIEPHNIIIVEGILILQNKELRDLADIKIFVDVNSDIRFIRRLKRDIMERNRSYTSIIKQYMETVKPMHETFVEPSKIYADIIIPHGGKNEKVLNMVLTFLTNKKKDHPNEKYNYNTYL